MLCDQDEARLFVQATGWIVLRDPETYGSVPLVSAGFDQGDEKPSSDPFASARGDDGDGQLGHIVSHEAVAMVRLRIRPITSRTNRSVLFANESVVALPRPSSEVQRISRIGNHLLGCRRRFVR